MKLPRSSVAALFAAHKSVQGDLEPKTRYSVAKNLVHLARAHKEVEKFRVELVKKLAPTTLEVKPDSPEWEMFTEAFYSFLESETEITLSNISFEGLNVEKNNTPVTAIAALEPLLLLDQPA
jgi:hypothetical protein